MSAELGIVQGDGSVRRSPTEEEIAAALAKELRAALELTCVIMGRIVATGFSADFKIGPADPASRTPVVQHLTITKVLAKG